ncbi:MAG TPA: ABC transporter permease [Thermoanaerobaculia bacterium]|jgi:predicted permease
MLEQDLVWAARTMRRNLGLTVAVVLSLGLALGANAAVWGVVDAFLLRPLGIREIGRMVRVRENRAEPGTDADLRSVSPRTFLRWREQNHVFASMAAGTDADVVLSGRGAPQRLPAGRVTANFFSTLGIAPALGRDFLAEEDRPGGRHVVLLGHGLWERRFGSAPGILGQTLVLNGQPHTVIGVMPRGLRHPYQAELWVPLVPLDVPTAPEQLYVPARLRSGVPLARARAEMARLTARLRADDPRPDAPRSADLSPLRGELVGDLDRLLALLSAVAGLVLLIACANASNLLLAQSLEQGGEAAVRTALGATRPALVRQFLAYSVLLGLAGGALGLFLAAWTLGPLVAISPIYALGEFDITPRIDAASVALTAAVSLAVGVVFGLVPALRLSRLSLHGALRDAGRGRSLGRGGRRFLGALVVSEVALALVVLVGAGLMGRSLQRILTEDRGFDRREVLTFAAAFPAFHFPDLAHKATFVAEVARRLRALPGVTAAGATTTQPLFPGTESTSFSVEGRPGRGRDGREPYLAHRRIITPGYLEALRVPLLRGRLLTERDDARAPRVVLVSRSFADRYWPGVDPIGKRLKQGRLDGPAPWRTVVGVVGTLVETRDELEPHPDALYFPYAQPTAFELDAMVFALRAAHPEGLAAAAREVVRGVDPDEPVYDLATMDDLFRRVTAPARFSAALYVVLGALGLVLAALGLHGVLSFSVSRRRREIGVRSALGASPTDLLLLVLRNGLGLTALGLALGTALSLAFGRLLGSQLHDVGAHDPWTLAGALLFLAVIALVSSLLPARRAARIDPLDALRQD